MYQSTAGESNSRTPTLCYNMKAKLLRLLKPISRSSGSGFVWPKGIFFKHFGSICSAGLEIRVQTNKQTDILLLYRLGRIIHVITLFLNDGGKSIENYTSGFVTKEFREKVFSPPSLLSQYFFDLEKWHKNSLSCMSVLYLFYVHYSLDYHWFSTFTPCQ